MHVILLPKTGTDSITPHHLCGLVLLKNWNLNFQKFVLHTKGRYAKPTKLLMRLRVHNPRLPRGGTGLFLRAEKVVVSRVRLELGLAHRTGGGGSSSSFGVQSLDEGDFGKELAARGPLLISD